MTNHRVRDRRSQEQLLQRHVRKGEAKKGHAAIAILGCGPITAAEKVVVLVLAGQGKELRRAGGGSAAVRCQSHLNGRRNVDPFC